MTKVEVSEDGTEESSVCTECQHPMDPHAVIATEGDPRLGGIVLCPECDCFSTWSVPQLVGKRRPETPSDEEIAYIRKQVFGPPAQVPASEEEL